MNPTCAKRTSAKATATLRNATSRNASARIRLAEGIGEAAAADEMAPWTGGCPTKIRITGTIKANITAATSSKAPANPNAAIAVTSSGTPAMPPKLAPFSARLIAMPRLVSNQRPSVLVIAPRLVPAQPNASTA